MTTMAVEPFSEVGDLLGLHRTALAVREHVVAMGASPVGSLSATEILVALYREVLRVRPEEPRWPGRDHFILGKGDAATALYATLAECGFFPVEKLAACDGGSVPGVEFTAGSRGRGLALGAGLALAARRDGRGNRVFVLMSAGDLYEDSAWITAAHDGLDNLTVIVDRNRAAESFEDRQRLETLAETWQMSEVDGHDFGQLVPALRARSSERPTLLLADTGRGRGVRHLRHRRQRHVARLAPVTALRAAA
jgi:transketolase